MPVQAAGVGAMCKGLFLGEYSFIICRREHVWPIISTLNVTMYTARVNQTAIGKHQVSLICLALCIHQMYSGQRAHIK